MAFDNVNKPGLDVNERNKTKDKSAVGERYSCLYPTVLKKQNNLFVHGKSAEI